MNAKSAIHIATHEQWLPAHECPMRDGQFSWCLSAQAVEAQMRPGQNKQQFATSGRLKFFLWFSWLMAASPLSTEDSSGMWHVKYSAMIYFTFSQCAWKFPIGMNFKIFQWLHLSEEQPTSEARCRCNCRHDDDGVRKARVARRFKCNKVLLNREEWRKYHPPYHLNSWYWHARHLAGGNGIIL